MSRRPPKLEGKKGYGFEREGARTLSNKSLKMSALTVPIL